MTIEKQTCPKCNSQMTPGFASEIGISPGIMTAEVPSRHVIGWHDSLPGGWSKGANRPSRVLLGFCCVKCGLVEFYAVSNEVLKQIKNS